MDSFLKIYISNNNIRYYIVLFMFFLRTTKSNKTPFIIVFKEMEETSENFLWQVIAIVSLLQYSRPSISAGSTSVDSTKSGLKIYGEKKSQKVPKSEIWVCP